MPKNPRPTYDLVFRNATLIDGLDNPRTSGDLAAHDGKIVAIGKFDGQGAREIDAAGAVLAPGFIDIHTHFDPQLCWDRLATPSLEHGVTTVVVGNCSLSLAPIKPEGRAKVVSMFQVIEDIKKPTFDAAVPFSWETFPQYLDFIRDGLGINVGALIGHSVVRHYVMGAASQERAATPAELSAMCNIVEAAMAAGAWCSSSYADVDENMHPVPSRFATLEEKIALAKAMAKSGRGVWQVVPYFIDPVQQIENIHELGEISLAAGVPCSLQPILSSPNWPGDSLAALEAEQARGARVYGQVMPRCFDLNMRLSETSMLLFGLPSWKSIMDAPSDERLARFSDAGARTKLVAEMKHAAGMSAVLPFLMVGSTQSPDNAKYQGRYLAEISQAEGKEIGEVILDLSIADGLDTEFQLKNVLNADKSAVARLIEHPLCHFGASDAGAHITQFCGTGDTTHLLEHYVRDTQTLTLERAVHRMTAEVADAWGIRNRGSLTIGKAADLVLFDLDKVHCGQEQFVDDFPGEARRYVRRAEGFRAVVVNGAVVFDEGGYTTARAGLIV
ncbi:MAG: amidohydrolase family protein [Gammaproteobacteria bacterium]|nr:amidohydrolase family protein [Gammaproteobacteria bacterium]